MDNTGYSTALKQRLFKRFPGIGNIEKEYNEYNAKYNLHYRTYDGLREINEYVLPRKKSYPVHRLLYGIFSLGLGAVLIYCGSGLLKFVLDLMLLEEWKEFTDFSGYINAITSTGNSHWMYQWVLRAVFWAFCLVVAFFVLYKLFNKIGIYLYDMSYPKDINRDLFHGEWYSSIRASKTLQK